MHDTDDGTDGGGGPGGEALDKHGRPLSAYPEAADAGRLLGINAFGNAAYASEVVVSLAVLDESGSLRSPPRHRRLAHEFPFSEVGMSPGEYVLYVADEYGPWRGLTAFAREWTDRAGVDPDRVVGTVPTERDAGTLVESLLEADSWADRAGPAGELRQLAMDRPADLGPFAADLVALLDDRADDGSGLAARGGVRVDVAFAVARTVRAVPDAVDDEFARLVRIAGEESLEAAETAYKDRLVDLLDVRGRQATNEVADRLEAVLTAEDAEARLCGLHVLYHLAYRYANGTHPLVADAGIRAAVAARVDDPDPAVAARADEVDILLDFE